MASFKKPFTHQNSSGLFEKIANNNYDPLPSETSFEVQMLIHVMLQKDYTERPSIFEIAYIQCIHNQINKLMMQNNYDYRRQIETYFSYDNSKQDTISLKGFSSLYHQLVEKPYLILII